MQTRTIDGFAVLAADDDNGLSRESADGGFYAQGQSLLYLGRR